jgi:hypothetical protein
VNIPWTLEIEYVVDSIAEDCQSTALWWVSLASHAEGLNFIRSFRKALDIRSP